MHCAPPVGQYVEAMTTIDALYDPRATTIQVVRYLIAVAEHRHFGRAAAACLVSQPTLSAQITQWERRLGQQVFERTGSGVRLTPIGEKVVAAARTALAGIQALEQAAAPSSPPFFGQLRVGVIPTLGPYLLPVVGAAIQARWPTLSWPVGEYTTLALLDRLTRNLLDVVIVAVIAGIRNQRESVTLFEEPFLAALPCHHRLASAARVTPAELGAEELLLLEDGHCLRDQALEVCGAQPAQGAAGDFRATSLETLRQFVALGHGVTVLPELAAHATRFDERIVVRPLDGRKASRTIALVWRTGDVRNTGYRLFGQVISASVRTHQLAMKAAADAVADSTAAVAPVKRSRALGRRG
jgi:LysR family hydrogen peroxide-inducible transcriptional activator